MNTSADILQLHDVNKSFEASQGYVNVLHPVSLTLAEGEFAMVTGPSGSGKSTFLHLAALLDVPTTGRLVFEEQETSSLADNELSDIRKNRIGIVFQPLSPRRGESWLAPSGRLGRGLPKAGKVAGREGARSF